MKSKTPAATALLQHYWLVSGHVHFVTAEGRDHRHFNVLSTTDKQQFNHTTMAKAQQLLQMRLVKEAFPEGLPEGFQIVDVVFLGVSHLGQMTQDEFVEGFADLTREQAAAAMAATSKSSPAAQIAH